MNILLLESLVAIPAEGLGKRASVDELVPAHLKIGEEFLQLIRNAVVFISVQVWIVLP